MSDSLVCPGCGLVVVRREGGDWFEPTGRPCRPPETKHADHIVSPTDLVHPMIQSLRAELAELERTDPAVGAAAANLDAHAAGTTESRDRVVDRAIRTIALRVIAQAANPDEIGQIWDLFPDIGEHDWIRITSVATSIIVSLQPPEQQYDAAYTILSSRANDKDPDDLPTF